MAGDVLPVAMFQSHILKSVSLRSVPYLCTASDHMAISKYIYAVGPILLCHTVHNVYIVQLYSPVVKKALGKGYIIRSKELDKIWCRFKSATCCMCYIYSAYCSISHSCHFRCCLGGPVEESCSALLQQQGAPGD